MIRLIISPLSCVKGISDQATLKKLSILGSERLCVATISLFSSAAVEAQNLVL